MRVPSSSPKTLKSGEQGWWHPLDGSVPVSHLCEPKREREKSCDEWKQIMIDICSHTNSRQYEAEAKQLGLPVWTLLGHGLACGYSHYHKAWAFVMMNSSGSIIGIRLRNDSGKKWAVRGSHSGIFIPNINPQPTMVVVEGPTDTMAGLSLGYYTVGRPSCAGGAFYIKELIQRLGCRRVVIIADNDEDDYEHPERPNPGLNGARALAACMVVPTVVLVLPVKDLRQFVNTGGSRPLLENLINSSIWYRSA